MLLLRTTVSPGSKHYQITDKPKVTTSPPWRERAEPQAPAWGATNASATLWVWPVFTAKALTDHIIDVCFSARERSPLSSLEHLPPRHYLSVGSPTDRQPVFGKATELYVRGTSTAQATHLQRSLWSPCVHTLTPPSHMHTLSLVLFPTLAFWGAATGLCSQNCQDPLLASPRVGADCCIHHVGHSFSKPACSGREGSGSEKHKYRGPALPSPYTLLPHKPREILHQNRVSPHTRARLPTSGNQKIGAILGPPFSPYLCQCPRYRFPIFLYCNILER